MNGRFLRRPAAPGRGVERIPVSNEEDAIKISGARPALKKTEYLTQEEYAAALRKNQELAPKAVPQVPVLPYERAEEIKAELRAQNNRPGKSDPAVMRRTPAKLSEQITDPDRLTAYERANLSRARAILEKRGKAFDINVEILNESYRHLEFDGFTGSNDLNCSLTNARGFTHNFTMSAREFLDLLE